MNFVEQRGRFVEREEEKAYGGGGHLVDEEGSGRAVGEETDVGSAGGHDGCDFMKRGVL